MEKHSTTLPHPQPQHQQPTAPTAPPPAYTPNPHTATSPSSPSSTDDEEEPDTTTLTLNAATQIRGSGNIISIPPLDATRLTSLIHNMLNGSPEHDAQQRPGNITININCGAVVVGDKNIVGPGLADAARSMGVGRPAAGVGARTAQAQMLTPPLSPVQEGVKGAKRKAEDEVEDAPSAKKLDTEDA